MEKKIIEIDGLKTYYMAFENKINKGDFLILHGWGGSSKSWQEIGKKIGSLGYNVFIPDLPGFGDTEIDKVYTIDDYAGFVEKFVKKVGIDNLILLGHSNGGRISIKLATRGGIKIKKLILNGAAGIKGPPTLKQKIFKIIAKIGKTFKKIPLYEKLRNLFYRAIGGQDYLNCENEFIKKTFLNMLEGNLKEELKNIKIPTLLIRGEKDTYTPLKDGKIMNELVKDSKMIILDGEKHGIHLQNPERLFEVLKDNL
ncbi:MAG: alpha/beta hydrolase [Candidatus Gracilibacteria bacterium]|nr:alpha/beta hydrolase [Candidatus Gracilibacteria bacterium]MDD3120551.1 alpha/beta hydrolase [Candidatus Gracilibacteria bacterium]